MKIQLNIFGGAFFQVQKQDDTYIYCLSRQFLTNDLGIIVTAEGYVLQNSISIPQPLVELLVIDEHGLVSKMQSGSLTPIGQIMVAKFEHPEELTDLGDGYYGETEGSGTVVLGIAGDEGFEEVTIHYVEQAGKKQRPLAVLNKPGAITDFISRMRSISLNMSLHTDLFPSPVPTLADFNLDIDALEDAETVTQTRVRGSVAVRNQKYDLVLDNVHNLQNYVQNLADIAGDVDDARHIIISSGFDIKTIGEHHKDELQAKHGSVSGIVLLFVKSAGKRSAYEWQMSKDETVWSNLPTTMQSKTSVAGLTPSDTLYFRSRPVLKDGVGEWTQAVSIIVN